MRLAVTYLLLSCLPPFVLWYAMADEQDVDLRFAVGSEVNSLDPQKMSWLQDIRIAECLFEPLVRVRLPDMTVEPAVAERWEISEDQLTYTFHLRTTARWSNGDPVCASDFRYAWQRAMLSDFAADYSQLFFRIEGAEAFFHFRAEQIKAYVKGPGPRNTNAAARLWKAARHRFDTTVGVRAPDDRTLVVRLARPTPYFIELCAFATFMPVHPASVEKFVILNGDTGMRVQDARWVKPGNLIGNGPFRLDRWRFKRDLVMRASEHYWNRDALGIRSIRQRVIEAPGTQWLAYRSGELDWLPAIPTTTALAADLVSMGRDDVHVVPAAGTYFYNFNCSPAFADGTPNPLSDARVRRAMAMAIDRRTLVEQVTRLGQPVARTFVPPDAIADYDAPVESGVTFEPKRAAELLSEAGHPRGGGLNNLTIMYNTGHGHELIAQAVKGMWTQHLGVDVALEGVEGRRFSERLKNHDYSIARAGWFGDYRDPTTFLDKFLTDNGNNDAAWSDEVFDELMHEASIERDRLRRMDILRRAEARMLTQQPVTVLCQYVTLHVFDPQRVHDLWPNPWNYRRLERVRVVP